GVFKDVPYNSTFWFHALVSIRQDQEWIEQEKNRWDSFYPKMYVTLTDGADENEVNSNIKDIVSRHVKDGSDPELFLHAMNRWYLYDSWADGKEAGGKIEYVRLFMAIGILILLIACINYINLSTARSQRRAKEVGIRKSIGSNKFQLVRQFMSESFLVTTVAFVIAVVIVQLALPGFNSMVHARLKLDYTSYEFWTLSIAVVVITAVASGSYPAFYFSAFRPIQVLRGNTNIGKGSVLPRNTLVSAQYIIAIFLLIGVTVVYQQIDHLHQRQLGYSQDNLICYAVNAQMDKNYNAIKNELLATGVVEAVSIANEGIDVDYFFDYVDWSGKTSPDIVQFSRISTDHDFVKTHGITIVAGRDFTAMDAADTTKVLVNETAVKLMHMTDPIGQKIKTRSGNLTIIGVMRDIVRSPFAPVNLCYVGLLGDGNNHMSVRVSDTDDIVTTLAKVNDVFKRLDPMNINEPEFVSERVEYGYRSINFVGQLSGILALLAIFLTCLGVLGLASYMAEQRAKELAIRKVLGANVARLLWLLSNYFVRMIVIAAVIATPISWWAADQYLENYVYRMNVPLWVIPVVVAGLLLFTLIIVTAQVGKSVRANPVNSLKIE
ncbi:MAG TPA: FtsX-like permease family protein, partial [Cyclobacteriaceae bacterium]|nr:FtsX-like permease family protein [Cyclobacteriaceae bacterium]